MKSSEIKAGELYKTEHGIAKCERLHNRNTWKFIGGGRVYFLKARQVLEPFTSAVEKPQVPVTGSLGSISGDIPAPGLTSRLRAAFEEKNEWTQEPSLVVDSFVHARGRLVIVKEVYRIGEAFHSRSYPAFVPDEGPIRALDDTGDLIVCSVCKSSEHGLVELFDGVPICEECQYGEDSKQLPAVDKAIERERKELAEFTARLHAKREKKGGEVEIEGGTGTVLPPRE